MRNNRSDGNIMHNTIHRNLPSNGTLLRPSSRNNINSYTQNISSSVNNVPPLRSLRGRIENRNLVQQQQHTSAVNLQTALKRGANNGLRDIQSEQNSFQQQQTYSSENNVLQDNFLQQVNDKLIGSNIHQRSTSLQKLKNMRESQNGLVDSPLKKVNNWNGQQLNSYNGKGYSLPSGQSMLQNQNKYNFRDSSDLQKSNYPQQYQHIPKFQDIRDAALNYGKGNPGMISQGNQSTNQLGMNNNNQMNSNQIEFKYNIDPSKKSSRSYGIIKAYAANTNMGIFRNYNEDRVSIILSISKPFNKNVDYWPKTSFFAIYDGHGGANCSDFLRDNLHLFIVRDEYFPSDPTEAIKRGVRYAEQSFLATAESTMDRSGSCAIIVMILDDIAYTVNIGDSRAITSINNGQTIQNLSEDHKPEDERQRIEAAGGKVYQSILNNQNLVFQGVKINPPHRVFPGKLSVSRTIGDFEAKSLKYGGNPKVIISDPDIVATKITSEYDFILLGCDGVFDRLNSQEVGKIFWNSAERAESKDENGEIDVHKQSGYGIEAIMRETFERKSLDNITLVAIAFDNFSNAFSKIQEKKVKESEKIRTPVITSYQQPQSVSMPPVIQNQNILPSSLQNSSNRGKLKQLHRNLNNNQPPSLVSQTYLFPKVSPTNAVENLLTYNEEQPNGNQITSGEAQYYSPSKQKMNTQTNESSNNQYNNSYLSTQSYQYTSNGYVNKSGQNQTHQTNISNVSNATNTTNSMPLINQNLYNTTTNTTTATTNTTNNNNPATTNEQNAFYSDIPLQENKISSNNFQSNSLNRQAIKPDIENAYFHKRARLSTPSTMKKYQNGVMNSITNTSSNHLQLENSKMAMQSAQSLQTLKALQNEKIYSQLSQIQQQQKGLPLKKK